MLSKLNSYLRVFKCSIGTFKTLQIPLDLVRQNLAERDLLIGLEFENQREA